MKIYCGTDIIEVERVKKAILSTPGFKEKVFTPLEIEYADKKSDVTRYIHYAGRFAAKEAVFKALSNNVNAPNEWKSIEIISGETGRPKVILKINKILIIGRRN